jgi:class 3 adenylate cyclase
LGEDARKPRFIETVHGRGYRFVSPVEADDREAPDRRETAVSGVTSEAESRLLDSPAVEPETPPHLDRRSPAHRRLAGERKRVTVLSGSLANAVPLAERLSLEALPHLRQRFLNLVQQSVEPYGGTFQSVGEDGFQVLFGVPVAQEDHARRAVQAALSLQQRLRDAAIDLDTHSDLAFAVRLGVHSGAVMVGSQGDEVPRAATVVGEVTPVAEQLQHRAASGMLQVSEDTLHLLHGNVRHEAVGTFAVPGQMTPLVAYTVHGLGPWRAPMMWRHAPALSRFVGRERELTVLQALLAQTEQGQGHVVGMMGEPGMGKSRLLYEFARHFPTQVTYLEGHCLSYGSATPYLPVLDMLRQLGGIMEADSPATIATKLNQCLAETGLDPVERSPHLRQLLGVMEGTESLRALSPQGIKRRTFATLHQLVLSRSQRYPLVIAIENLHWIDSTSQEWLLGLVEHLATSPLLLLTTYRPGYRPVWMDKSYATQLALIRLTPEDSRAVVQSVLQRETLPEDLLHELLTRAAGNPFFLEELTRAVVEREDGQPPLEVPDSVQAVLAARMDRLPLAEKGLLQTASVIGNDVPIALLQAVADVPESGLDHALQHLQAAEFLYEIQSETHRVYTFKHALTQEVAYQSLLLRTRQRLHQEIAQVLEEHFPETAEMQPEVLAHHYTEAGLNEPAVGYWQQAGEQARSHAADVEAIAHFRKGLEVLTTLPATLAQMRRELDLYILLALAYTASKGQAVPEVEQAYVKARELCEQVHDDNQLFRALIGLTRCYGVRSQYQKGEKLSDALLQVAQPIRHAAVH